MPDIETFKNCWKRNGGAPEDILLSDLEDDGDRLNELGGRDPELACVLLVSRRELVDKFQLGVLIRLLEAAETRPEAAAAREPILNAIIARFEADVDKESCDAAVACLEDKGLLERAEFERLPAVKRRGAQRRLKKMLLISLIAAAAILVLLCVLLIFGKKSGRSEATGRAAPAAFGPKRGAAAVPAPAK